MEKPQEHITTHNEHNLTRWKKLVAGHLKCNLDAVIFEQEQAIKTRSTIRDQNGCMRLC